MEDYSALEAAKLMLAIRKWHGENSTPAENYCRLKIQELYKLQNYQQINPLWLFAVLELYQLTHEHKYKEFASQLIKTMPKFKAGSKEYIILAGVYAKYFQIFGDERFLNIAKKRYRLATEYKKSNPFVLMWLCMQLYESCYEPLYLSQLISFANAVLIYKPQWKIVNKFLYFLYVFILCEVYGKTKNPKYLQAVSNCPFLNLVLPRCLIIFSLRTAKDVRKAINIAHGKFCPFVSIIMKTQFWEEEREGALQFLKHYPVLLGKNTYYIVEHKQPVRHTHDLFDVYDFL